MLLTSRPLISRSGKNWTGGKNWTDIYFFPSLLTYGTAYESPEVGLSYASKIIAKLVLVAELYSVECTGSFPGFIKGGKIWTGTYFTLNLETSGTACESL